MSDDQTTTPDHQQTVPDGQQHNPQGAEERKPAEEPRDTDGFKSEDSKRRVLEDLHTERENRRKLAEERDALAARVKEFEDAKLSDEQKRDRELEERAKRIAQLEQENTDYRRRELRRTVAADLELPSWAVDRLRGDTEDELRADAEQFKTNLTAPGGTPGRPRPDNSQGARPGEKPSDDDLLYQTIYGK